jgi:hypothetical protein
MMHHHHISTDLQQLLSLTLPNDGGHCLSKPQGRRNTKLRFVEADSVWSRAHDAVIARHGQQAATSRGVAVDCCDDRLRMGISKTEMLFKICGGRGRGLTAAATCPGGLSKTQTIGLQLQHHAGQ